MSFNTGGVEFSELPRAGHRLISRAPEVEHYVPAGAGIVEAVVSIHVEQPLMVATEDAGLCPPVAAPVTREQHIPRNPAEVERRIQPFVDLSIAVGIERPAVILPHDSNVAHTRPGPIPHYRPVSRRAAEFIF